MGVTNQDVGVRGEDVAARHLEELGWQILARNWRCPAGELDLIAVEHDGRGPTLVVCEVKCRTGLGYGDPLEAITYAKLAKLRDLTQHWLRSQAQYWPRIRLDAVGVLLRRGYAPQVNHVRGLG